MNKQIHFFTSRIVYKIKAKTKLINGLEGLIYDLGKVPGAINFILSDDRAILKINKEYLQRDTLTDVISFNFSEEESVVSGDIYISFERVKDNAEKYKVEVEQELRRVLVHGVLHLAGYDDSTALEKREMRRRENLYLKRF